jgi:arylformamidase
MSSILDISVPLGSGTPVWPDSKGIKLVQIRSMGDGYHANETRLTCDVHSGTHIDAPLHFIPGGKPTSGIPLDVLVGDALVCSLSTDSNITDVDMENAGIRVGTERLLLKTRNSRLWKERVNVFQKDYVALTPKAARWLVYKKIRLVGIDYLSIQPFEDKTQETHKILLSAGIVILEGINLSDVQPGEYELFCLPLLLDNTDGSPARAVLRKQTRHNL